MAHSAKNYSKCLKKILRRSKNRQILGKQSQTHLRKLEDFYYRVQIHPKYVGNSNIKKLPVVVYWVQKFGITKNWKSIHQRGGKFQLHEQHKSYMCDHTWDNRLVSDNKILYYCFVTFYVERRCCHPNMSNPTVHL